MSNEKVVAFYLPQYHPIPENDKAYGKNFTEWVNVKKASPLFENHNQPRIPLENNYYSLLDKNTMIEQSKLAKSYGIYGFCYYHYWFKNGKKLLEKPLEMMLNTKEIDIPFMLCWANENWTKRWDGGNNEIIVEQDYGDYNDLINHIDYLCRFFRDKRYIKIDNKPVLVIYKPEIIPRLKKIVDIIQKRVIENGLPGIVLASQYPDYYFSNRNNDCFDYHIQFQPKFIQDYEIEEKNLMRRKIKHFMLSHNMNQIYQVLLKKYQSKKKKALIHRDYCEDWKKIIDFQVTDEKLMAGAFVDWDNTPRNKNGLVYDNANPQLFERFFSSLVKKVNEEYSTEFIFINAWNEWAEGAYLEADEKNQYGYLEAIKRVLNYD